MANMSANVLGLGEGNDAGAQSR